MKHLFVALICSVLLIVSGCQGVSVVNANINENGELIMYLSDGSSLNAGLVRGSDGKDGADGIDGTDGTNGENGKDGEDGICIVKAAVNDSGELIIRMSDGSLINAGIVNGKDGKDGQDGLNGIDGKDGKDGKDGTDGLDGSIPILDMPVSISADEDNIVIPPDIPATVSAVSSDDVFITDTEDPSLLTGYAGNDTDVTVPDGIHTIGRDTFKNNTSLRSVVIPASVTVIGENAFSGCTALSSVEFSPECSLAEIRANAFEGCPRLTNLDFPDNDMSIAASAFKDSSLSGTITFHGSVSIGEHAFENTLIDSIVLNGTGNMSFTASASSFANCINLSSINLACRQPRLELADDSFLNCSDFIIYTPSRAFAMKYSKSLSASSLGLSGSLAIVWLEG